MMSGCAWAAGLVGRGKMYDQKKATHWHQQSYTESCDQRSEELSQRQQSAFITGLKLIMPDALSSFHPFFLPFFLPPVPEGNFKS